MNTLPIRTHIIEGEPHTFGWQRRKDHDTTYGEAWERPDGKFFLYPRGKRLVLQKLGRGTLPAIPKVTR